MSDTNRYGEYPYGGTSGHSGSEASAERAQSEDRSGVTSMRQRLALQHLGEMGRFGMTWREFAEVCGIHHGQASGALSALHKRGRIARLTVKRGRSQVYVLPQHVDGRVTSDYRPNVSARLLVDVLHEIDGLLSSYRTADARKRIAQVLETFGG